MARLRVETGWERLIVPAFVYFFAQLYPFRRVNRAGARTAAAAGGCVLLRTGAAERARIPDVDPARGHRRRGAGAGGAARRWPHLAGARRPGGQRAALSAAARTVADGLAQRVRAAAPQPAAAGSARCSGWRLVYLVPPLALARRARRRASPGGGVRRRRVGW